jgi:hypothetical protein
MATSVLPFVMAEAEAEDEDSDHFDSSSKVAPASLLLLLRNQSILAGLWASICSSCSISLTANALSQDPSCPSTSCPCMPCDLRQTCPRSGGSHHRPTSLSPVVVVCQSCRSNLGRWMKIGWQLCVEGPECCLMEFFQWWRSGTRAIECKVCTASTRMTPRRLDKQTSIS